MNEYDKYGKGCGKHGLDNAYSAEILTMVEQMREKINQQAEQIERMKCCGNCEKGNLAVTYPRYDEDGHEAEIRCIWDGKVVSKTHKCDKWEGQQCQTSSNI